MTRSILLVDDEQTVLRGLSRIISWYSKNKNVRIYEADNSIAAEMVMLNYGIDVLIVDNDLGKDQPSGRRVALLAKRLYSVKTVYMYSATPCPLKPITVDKFFVKPNQEKQLLETLRTEHIRFCTSIPANPCV